jgi:hypothetical protein
MTYNFVLPLLFVSISLVRCEPFAPHLDEEFVIRSINTTLTDEFMWMSDATCQEHAQLSDYDDVRQRFRNSSVCSCKPGVGGGGATPTTPATTIGGSPMPANADSKSPRCDSLRSYVAAERKHEHDYFLKLSYEVERFEELLAAQRQRMKTNINDTTAFDNLVAPTSATFEFADAVRDELGYVYYSRTDDECSTSGHYKCYYRQHLYAPAAANVSDMRVASLTEPEELLLNVSRLASAARIKLNDFGMASTTTPLSGGGGGGGDLAYVAVDAVAVSSDGRFVAYLVDFRGDERYELRIVEVVGGTRRDVVVARTYANGTLFYSTRIAYCHQHLLWLANARTIVCRFKT